MENEKLEQSVVNRRDPLETRFRSLVARGLLEGETAREEFGKVYSYAFDFVLPIYHHWIKGILDDFGSSREDNQYLLFYLRDAYPALQIARTVAEKEGSIPAKSIIPVHVSRKSIKNSHVLSYLARILPKDVVVADNVSLWHVDTGVYGSIQDRIVLDPLFRFCHHLCLLEYIPERYGLDLSVRYFGGHVHAYYKPEDNDHILIHLVEGLFNLGSTVIGYEPGSLAPVFDGRDRRYVWEHAARLAVRKYCNDRLRVKFR